MTAALFSPCIKTACLGTLLALVTACGSNSDAPTTTDDSGPVVDVETGSEDCTSTRTISALSGNGENCDTDSEITNSETTYPTLSLGTAINDSVAEDAIKIYKIPSDTEIILTTTSGNADLYLYGSTDFEDGQVLCAASNPFREDNCTASVSDNELYAVVYGRVASSYSLNSTTDCSVESINNWVYRNMQDYYLYADQVPNVNPASYTDSSDLVKDLRFEELDPYSGISNATSREDFFEQGLTFGGGFDWARDAADNLRITYVYDDSPFGRANVRRGDIVNSIGGVSIADLTSDTYYDLIGDSDNPRSNVWVFTDVDSSESKSVNITFGDYTVNTVMYVNAFTHPDFSGKVGYIVFNSFLRISEAELNAAFEYLKSVDVTELVLDLRYNGGGFTSIARRLAAQIAGPSLAGNTLVRYEYNSKYPNANFFRNFEAVTPNIALDRLVVLTTSSTASSSELLINSLRPYMEVITIGDTTRGKAFISSSRNFCGKALNAMEAQGVNASGVSVAGGIPADCYAADDTTRDFGRHADELEGMLRTSLDYYVFGRCDSAPMASGIRTIAQQQKRPIFSAKSESSFGGSIEDSNTIR